MQHKYLLPLLLLALLALPSVSAAAIATYRAGDITILRLTDQEGGIPAKALVNVPKEALDMLPNGICPSQYVTVLVKSPKETILIDTGNGVAKGGKTLKLLQQQGISPKDITKIFLTHMHPDHVGGLITGGQKTFPNAVLYVSRTEFTFWTNKANAPKAPANQAGCFDTAKSIANIYQNKIHLFSDTEEFFPGFKAVPLPGHTEGHAGFLLTHAGKRILFVGDLLHCLSLQTLYPDVTVIWDSNQDLARTTRKELFQRLNNTDTILIGGHFPAPGALHLTSHEKAGYKFVQPEN